MIICLTGPTGIGKTKLSIMLAQKYNAIIVNADATQIYQELNIGSSKITCSEMQGIKHYLIDIKNPNEDYSVCDFQKDARKIISENPNQNIIVVGGTGLYLKSLFYDYQFAPQKENNYEQYSNEELYELVNLKNPNHNIHPNNRRRLINCLNNDNQTSNKDQLLYDNVIFIGLTLERSLLYELINKRVDLMVESGLEEEVRTLYQKYPESNILKRAIGYKEMIMYFNQELNYNDAIDLIKKNTRHYVKRQYTWFNNQMNLNWFNVDINNFNNTYEEIICFIESLNSK